MGLSLAEFPIASFVYQFFELTPKLGAWWGVLLLFIGGLCSMISLNKGWVLTSCILTSLGIVIGLVGSIVDAIAGAVFDNLNTCAAPNQPYPELPLLTYYGNTNFYLQSLACFNDFRSIGRLFIFTPECFCLLTFCFF